MQSDSILEIRSARQPMRTRLPAVSVPSAGFSDCLTAHDGLGLGAAAEKQAIRMLACCLEGASWEMWAASGKLQPASKRMLCGMQVQDGRRGPSQGAMGLFGALAAVQIALLPVSGGPQLAALAGAADYQEALLSATLEHYPRPVGLPEIVALPKRQSCWQASRSATSVS